MSEEVKQEEQSEEFNIDSMVLTNKISEVHQEGNYLVAVSENGIRFRQHIKGNKLLVKEGDKYMLIDRVVG